MQTGLNIYLGLKHTNMGGYQGNQGWEQNDMADLTIPERGGTVQQYHDTNLAGYDTDLNQQILKLKKGDSV